MPGARPLFSAAGSGSSGVWGGRGGRLPYVPSASEVCEDYLGVPGLDLAAEGGLSLVSREGPGGLHS